jgi:hypothetical protein
MRQQRVLVGDVSVSMKADRRDIVGPLVRFFVQRLDVFQDVFEFKISGFELMGGESKEHEGIV